MESYIVSLDVGGTSIKAGIVGPEFNLVDMNIVTYPSESDKSASTIIENFINVIYDQWSIIQKRGGKVKGVGFGFPGPFDYQRGISFMQGIGKFDSIYGMNISSEIKRRILLEEVMDITEDFCLLFENDATVFTLGECFGGSGAGFDKVMCLTLGTGCGSTFLYKREILKGERGAPENGWIFDQPLKDGIIDDYISRRGILKIAASKGFDTIRYDVQDIDILARKGDRKALEVFQDFGVLLGDVLNEYCSIFRPDIVIIGGKISKGFDLFKEEMYKRMPDWRGEVKVSEDLSKSALLGAASLFEKNRQTETVKC